jgi:hypothetical protein
MSDGEKNTNILYDARVILEFLKKIAATLRIVNITNTFRWLGVVITYHGRAFEKKTKGGDSKMNKCWTIVKSKTNFINT